MNRIEGSLIHLTVGDFSRELVCRWGLYANGRPALVLLDPNDGQTWWTATVNLPEYNLAYPDVFLKGWSENEGLPEALEQAGLFELRGWEVKTGHVYAQVATMTQKAMMEYLQQREADEAERAAEERKDT